ncbi:MAG: hypothetical protein V3V19_11310 [Cocleimonas sp.]
MVFSPTYVTAVRVANILNLTTANGDAITSGNIDELAGSISEAIINDYIEGAEQHLDDKCNRAWRLKTVDDYEYHDFLSRDYYGAGYWGYGGYGRKSVVKDLKFDEIMTLDNGEGDVLELLTTTDTWTDLLITGSSGGSPQDSNGDYFLQGKEGKLYLLGDLPIFGYDVIRLKYRYGGNETVPASIGEATGMRAASRILDWLPDTIVRSEDSGGPSWGDLQKRWTELIADTIKQYNNKSFKPIYL